MEPVPPEVRMQLTAEEARVLGCLIEKEATVPDTYPMTLNALRVGCNQSTNRDPVVDYDDATVEAALAQLRQRGLTRIIHPSHGSRTIKYRHVADEVLGLEDGPLAVLAVLLLRGPQTLGELRVRTERAHPFDSIDDVAGAVRALVERDEPLVAQLERQPGQKDFRVAHLLCGDPPVTAAPAPRLPVPPADALADLRAEVVQLRAALAELARRLGEEDLLE